MKTRIGVLVILASLLIGGCATTLKKSPAALDGDYSGKDFSGSFAVIRAAGDIPHVPASVGKTARFSTIEKEQILYLDGICQAELFKQLPGWAQAIAEEGGWSALAIALGQAAFIAALPAVEVETVRYFLAGLGYGAFAGANTGRYRQESSDKSSAGYCVLLQVWDANQRYSDKKNPVLEGLLIIPWYGNGKTKLPDTLDPVNSPTLEHVDGQRRPLPR